MDNEITGSYADAAIYQSNVALNINPFNDIEILIRILQELVDKADHSGLALNDIVVRLDEAFRNNELSFNTYSEILKHTMGKPLDFQAWMSRNVGAY